MKLSSVTALEQFVRACQIVYGEMLLWNEPPADQALLSWFADVPAATVACEIAAMQRVLSLYDEPRFFDP